MKLVKKTDILIIATMAVLCLAAIALYRAIASKQTKKAEIYCYGELAATVDLDQGKDYTFSIPQNPNVVFHVYKDGGIAFESSDCPDKVCVKTGKLYMVGQSAACLPNGIVLKIVALDRGNAPDIVVGK